MWSSGSVIMAMAISLGYVCLWLIVSVVGNSSGVVFVCAMLVYFRIVCGCYVLMSEKVVTLG